MKREGGKFSKGWFQGDEEGEFTFTGGRGNTVIDYASADIETEF